MNGAARRARWLRLILSILALMASCLAGLVATASSAAAAPATCGFATPGTGTYASTLCWFDMSGYNASQATSAGGQAMTIDLPDGYTLTFTLNVSGAAVKADALPTYSGAFLGKGGYTGIPGDPSLYQTTAGTTTAVESNISMTDPGGAAVTDYSLIGADAESTDSGESITWTSSGPLTLLSPLGNSCGGGFVFSGLDSVKCTGLSNGNKTGAAILGSTAPTSLTQSMVGSGLEAIGFGVLVSGVELNKTVVNGFSGDAFGLSVKNDSNTVIGSANTGASGTSASTGVITLITNSAGEAFTLGETATAGSLANYTPSWSCTRNGAPDATLPSGTTPGSSGTVTLGIGDLVDCTITNTANAASLSIVKDATVTDVNNDGLVDAGDTIAYSFTVTNTGTIQIDNVAVNDPKAGAVTCPQPSLPAGNSETCTADSLYTITAADVTAGSVTNTATASGGVDGSVAGTVTSAPSSTTTVTTAPAPSLTMVKSVFPTSVTAAGQSVTYSFLITNTGNVTITDVGVNEISFSGTGTLSTLNCPPGAASLAPGAHVTCTATYTATQADIDAGSVTNKADAFGTDPAANTITSPSSTSTFTATPDPSLSVVKSASPAGPAVLHAGDVITYSFVVTNTGNVTITAISINEIAFDGTGTLSAINCPAGAASLAPTDQVTCTATYTVTQADVDAGTISNTATASGTPPAGVTGPITSPPSTVILPETAQPALTLVKSASPTTMPAVGQTLTYSFAVTNTGNVTITAISINEIAFNGTGTLSAINCPAGTASLAPGDQVTCTATYVITQADIDASDLSNTATASGTPPAGVTGPITSPPSTIVVTANQQPALTIVKSASPTTPPTVGETITYSFLITNTGNVTIANVAVDEIAFTGTGTLSAINCPPGVASMAPQDQVTCTATYVVTQADVDNANLSNTATATGTPPAGLIGPTTSPPSTVVVVANPQPSLTVAKSASPTTISTVGQVITYSFLITNTGNVTITNATVNEGTFTGSATLSGVSCPAGAASLAPQASVTCTATYTVTQQDLDAGSISNSATASGQDPAATTITSPPSTAKVTSTAASRLGLVKSGHAVDVNHDGVIDVGDRIDWKLVATNLGATTITDIALSDPTAGTVTCPHTSLAPGASMTCSVASHTITAADAKAGHVTNIAIAKGKLRHTVLLRSHPASATIDVHKTPKPSNVLPFTGFPSTVPLTAAGAALILLGLLMVTAAAIRRRDTDL